MSKNIRISTTETGDSVHVTVGDEELTLTPEAADVLAMRLIQGHRSIVHNQGPVLFTVDSRRTDDAE